MFLKYPGATGLPPAGWEFILCLFKIFVSVFVQICHEKALLKKWSVKYKPLNSDYKP